MRPRIICLVNDGGVIVVGRTNGNPTRATSLRIMLDLGAQLVMIGKQLALDLDLGASNLESCPFTIVTLVGGMEKAMGYTRHPL